MKSYCLALCSFIILAGCSHSKRVTPPATCIEDKNADLLLEKLIPVIDRMADGKTTELKLVSDQCWKRIYSKNDTKLVMYQTPDKKDIQLSTAHEGGTPELSKACFDHARLQLNEMDKELSENILKTNETKNPLFFADPEVGAVKWIQCQHQNTEPWIESLAELLHELNHGNRSNQDCVYSPFENEQICFAGMSALPLRSLGKLIKFPVSDKKTIPKLDMIQKIYLTDIDQPFPSLLDELLAYTITMRTFNQALKTKGIKFLYRKDGTRPGVLVPLFQIYTIHYLDLFFQKDPMAFKKAFISDTANLEGLKKILKKSEDEYRDWQKTLRNMNKDERDSERELRQDFEKRKARFNKKMARLGLVF